jgi:REP element-mobilizing transposase RayT
MPRRLRIQYPGAIYHLMARGNGRQDIVRDDHDRQRLLACLERSVTRCSWRVYAFVLLNNHLHLVLKTPQPNLARGMQVFLSSYANAWARRHRFVGHVFQGRYRTELVEDETYLWSVTRYVHLNPVRAGLAAHPIDWRWSSYPGYSQRRRRLEWVAYNELLRSWEGAFGGSDVAGSYRRFVTAGLAEPPSSPWLEAKFGWVLGSAEFAARLGELVRGVPPRERRRESRLVQGIELRRVCDLVCKSYDLAPSELARRGSRHEARPVLAHLAREYTECTHAELAPILGVSRPESVPNLTRRFDATLASRKDVRLRLNELEEALRAAPTTDQKT